MGKEDTVRKGMPGGYAPLNDSGYMPVDYVEDFKIKHRKLSRDHYAFTDATYNCWAYDDILFPNASLNAITINLTAASDYAQRILTIKCMDATNNVTIQANGTDNIDGAGSFVLTIQYETIQLYSDGSNWHILSKYL